MTRTRDTQIDKLVGWNGAFGICLGGRFEVGGEIKVWVQEICGNGRFVITGCKLQTRTMNVHT